MFFKNRKDTGKQPTRNVGRDEEASVNPMSTITNRNAVYVFSGVVFALVAGVMLAIFWPKVSTAQIIIALALGLLAASTVRVAPQWEKVIILRLGRYVRTCGPGVYFVIPFIEHASAHVDQRTQTTTFYAEEALTEDLVPVDVDAVLFWVVWDPTKACLEVQDYIEAVVRSAQTALRDAIGCVELADLSHRRRQLDHDLQVLLDAKCAEWGISVSSVEVKNIFVPKELQDALSRKAQADREREARMALAEAERDVSEIYVEAAEVYQKNTLAVQLRAMNLVNEGVKEKGGMVVVPTAYGEGFGSVEDFATKISS